MVAVVGSDLVEWFQPSPGQKAGCNLVYSDGTLIAAAVSTLTRPEGRMQPVRHGGSYDDPEVSTLTRPEGRMQHDFVDVAVE